jgi:bifunctional glutamyl/prolyl-tRNA synthetase
LKSSKAAKDLIDKSVAELLSLKGEYKKVTGNDWKPEVAAPVAPVAQPAAVVKQELQAIQPAAASNSTDAVDIFNEIKKIGDNVRDLKAKKATKVS